MRCNMSHGRPPKVPTKQPLRLGEATGLLRRRLLSWKTFDSLRDFILRVEVRRDARYGTDEVAVTAEVLL